jgi:hypothetical protein
MLVMLGRAQKVFEFHCNVGDIQNSVEVNWMEDWANIF